VRRGVEQLFQAFQSVGLKLSDVEGERFQRIAHIRKLVSEGALEPDLRRRRLAIDAS